MNPSVAFYVDVDSLYMYIHIHILDDIILHGLEVYVLSYLCNKYGNWCNKWPQYCLGLFSSRSRCVESNVTLPPYYFTFIQEKRNSVNVVFPEEKI